MIGLVAALKVSGGGDGDGDGDGDTMIGLVAVHS